MTFIYCNPEPDSPIWLLHLPSQTLARLHLNTLPNHTHFLTVEAEQPPADGIFQSFAKAVEIEFPGSHDHLVMRTSKSGAELPQYIVLCHLPEGDTVIHYPALGFAAGIRADGSKIPPAWTHYHSFDRAQRSLIIKRAADALMQELAACSK